MRVRAVPTARRGFWGMVTQGFTLGYFRVLPDGRRGWCSKWGLWFPTLESENDSRMGHPAILDSESRFKDGAPGSGMEYSKSATDLRERG
jgi:hypothetical protein